MSQSWRFVLALVVPVALLAVSVWLWARVLPRRRAFFAEHPEKRPYGWNLVLRVVPFMALGVFCAFQLGGGWLLLLPVMLIAFAWDIVKRWRPPTER